MLAQVINDEVFARHELPRTGVLSDGRTVSNYYLLPPEVLESEGWRELEQIRPECGENEYLVHDRYEILEDKVIEYFRTETWEEV